MAFTNEFNTGTPQGTESKTQGDNRIRELKGAVLERLQVDHDLQDQDTGGEVTPTPPAGTTIGYHKTVTLIKRSADPSVGDDLLIIYSKEVSGVVELFARFENDGTVLQLTSGGKILLTEFEGNYILLDEQGSAPATAENQGGLYTKEVDGQTELFFREESSGDEIQITSGGELSSSFDEAEWEAKLNVIRDNIALNFFLDGGSKQNLEDGIVNRFEAQDEGIDTGQSSGENYDSTGDYYSGYYQSTVWSKSLSVTTGNYAGYHMRTVAAAADVTDQVSTEVRVRFVANSQTGGELQVDLAYLGERDGTTYDMKTSPGKVKLTFSGADGFSIGQGATQWSDWVSFATDGLNDLLVSVDFGSNTAGKAYVAQTGGSKLWSSTDGAAQDAAPGGGTVNDNVYHIDQIEFKSAGNMVLVGSSETAEAEPDTGRIVAFVEPVDSITINTDLKAYISKDGGTSWTEVTLVDEGDYDSGKKILSCDPTALSGTGTSMKWKIQTFNQKNIRVHGVQLQWE